ncbi:MAG: UDP-glucose/GDP-mannose dehydrogenase family protein [Planctomycetes bacterium]|nr:UDP-glucose/GDP-mannose dehydrogenase family protein [Planctomycetota bacterium]MBM4079287.1 UDP-glucose/GDP-mannose dehydrogenase family protein [Planctomycetota bacterium]MBM4085273.1 UDP-glucose/GDP-mannose dehydrogenase family protein [Planctomycetota bacterium]
MRISVVGTGYVGLVTGTCFAEMGHEVVCVDSDAAKIARLNEGKVPIYEPGLEELVRRNMTEQRLRFTTSLGEAVKESLINFIAVGTPVRPDGGADTSAVLDVARDIGKTMDAYKVVVTKSTVPVGTAERVREAIAQQTEHEFDVVSNPEFLKEGSAVDDFMRPDRIIIGTDDVRVAEIMKELYAPFLRTEKPILVMDIRSAELTKYVANAMLATRISFMNEVANLCEKLGANVDAVRRGVGSDSRIGFSFLFPGVGYGGSCFPKDAKALVQMGATAGYEPRIIKAADAVNAAQKRLMVDKVVAHFGDPRGRKIAVWGLAFKPKTDDMREAPSIAIITELLERGVRVTANDPEALEQARRLFGDRIEYCKIDYDALRDADALILVTEWNEYRRPDFERMKRLMRTPVVFDGRNIYDPKAMRKIGFTYYSIGRP